MNTPTIWLVARASGFLAYGLITASVLAGLTLKARPFGKRLRGATAMEIHRTLSFLGLAAIGLHGLALVMDRAVDIRIIDLVVPGTSPYRPLWTALGVVAAELALLLIVSFPLRRVIGAGVWRRLHWASYLAFVLATLHGITAGTDTSQPWARSVYIGAVACVAGATTWRALAARGKPVRAKAAAPQTPSRPGPGREQPAR
jgi:DMSO/TMAO reductase YedYZ heme-binding membrane subunit